MWCSRSSFSLSSPPRGKRPASLVRDVIGAAEDRLRSRRRRGRRVDPGGPGRYASPVKRLELVRIRVCNRCGRGGAELRGEDAERLVVPLDPVRARQLAGGGREEDVRSFTDLVLEQLAAAGVEAREVVLDVAEGRLRALFSFVRTGETDVVGCTAEEGVALALRGGL